MNLFISDADIDDLEKELNALDKHNKWHFDKSRRDAIKNHNDIQACPGSGKTSLVAAKLLLLAKKWNKPYQGVCVLSHTNVAKNEIIQKLQLHPAGQIFLQYPHFIGTIQEFVDKFLAIPFLKSCNLPIREIVSNSELSKEYLKLKWKKYCTQDSEKSYFLSYYHHQNKFSFDNLTLCHIDGNLIINPVSHDKKADFLKLDDRNEFSKYLRQKRDELIKKGFFTYNEMYEFSLFLLNKNSGIASAIRKRFPFIILDEMQDTAEHQDKLLNQIFSNSDVIYQRFGDPDQAIFGGESGDKPNTSYNHNDQLEVIQSSHRFCSRIANLAKGISCNQINLTSSKTEITPSGKHTIFLIDENSRDKVPQAFAKLCSTQHVFFQNEKPVIKAVGAVGKEKDGATIRSYFTQFNNEKNLENFNSQHLIDYFHCNSFSLNEHNQTPYKNRLKGILKLIRLATEDYKSKRDFLEWLDNEKKKIKFNTLLLRKPSNKNDWNLYVDDLLSLLSIDNRDDKKIAEFLAYTENNVSTTTATANKQNQYVYKDVTTEKEIHIDIGTIHSVKGETHDATLVLECKNHENDISALIKHLLQLEQKNIKGARLLSHARKIYVAMTRPKYLLCLAVDKNSIYPAIGDNLADTATQLGWSIVDLTSE